MPTVLFTDADRESRGVYAWRLSSYSFEVETGGDVLECLARLRRAVPDLLILDLDLPWGGGDGVLAILREDPRLLPTRVVLTWAVAPAHVLDRLAWHPVVQTLTKPFPLSALFERAALAAFLEHEKRPGGSQSRSAAADRERAGLPAAPFVTGGRSRELTPGDTVRNSRVYRHPGRPVGCPSWAARST